jgi:hypothetical protein
MRALEYMTATSVRMLCGKRQKIIRETLEEIRAVVVEYLGGVVAVRHEDHWLSFEEAGALPWKALAASRWFFFLPKDWEEQRRVRFQARTHENAARGEAPNAWELTESLAVADQARLELRGEIQRVHGDQRPLHHLLRAERLRRGLTVRLTARDLGVSHSLLVQWENGSKPIPPERAERLTAWVHQDSEPLHSH